MESFGQDEPLKPEQRREVVSNFVRDVSEGKISLGLDYKGRRPEDIQLISDILGRLVSYLNDYILGLKAGEEFDFLERQLFFCISVLRTYDAFKTNLNKSEVQKELQKLETKIDDSTKLLNEVLSNIQKITERKGRGAGKVRSKSRPKADTFKAKENN